MAQNIVVKKSFKSKNLKGTETSTILTNNSVSTTSGTDTPSEILAKLVTVDGAGSGLDADKLDGQDGNYYYNPTNANLPTVDWAAKKLTVYGGGDLNLQASSGSTDSGDIVFMDGSGVEMHRIYAAPDNSENTLRYRHNIGTSYQLYHSGNSNIPTVDWNANNLNAIKLGINLVENYGVGKLPETNVHIADMQPVIRMYENVSGNNVDIITTSDDGYFQIRRNSVEQFRINDSNIAVSQGGVQLGNSFVDGFAGNGGKFWVNGGLTNLSLDNLTVRGSMNVYELIINKIRATNGSLYVSDSGKIKYVADGGTYMVIYTEDANTFLAGDLVKCQVFTGNGIKSYIVKVGWIGNNTTGDYIVYYKTDYYIGGTGVNVPAIGDTLVRIGSNTTTSRQGNIYLTNSDTNAPYIQIADGVTSSNLAGTVKLRIGKLDGITSTVFGSLTGYGSYTYNGYYEGNINATGGKIGGFTINANDLSNNYLAVNSATNSFDLYITDVNGSSGIRLYHGAKDSSPSYLGRIYAGTSAQYGDTVSILSSNAISLSSVNTIVTGGLTVNGTATSINNLSATNITANQLELTGNIYSESNLTVDGISTIVRPTTTLTISYSGIYAGYSSYAVNGRREGKTNFLTINGVTTSSSKSWQKLAQITNYISPGYTVYFTSVFYTIGVDVYENMPGYIDTSGNIYMQPVVNKNFAANVAWITA